jgi:hypothetical protein
MSDLALLKEVSEWDSLATGIENPSDQLMQMVGTKTDPFDGVALDSNFWDFDTFGTGSLNVTGGQVEMLANNISGTMFWSKNTINTTRSGTYQFLFNSDNLVNANFPVIVWTSGSQPAAGPFSAVDSVTVQVSAAGVVSIVCKFAGAYRYFNVSTGAWQAGSVGAYTTSAGVNNLFKLIIDGALGTFRIEAWEASVLKARTSSVLFSSLDNVGSHYFVSGSPWSNISLSGDLNILESTILVPFPTSSPVATMGEINPNATWTNNPFEETLEAGATIGYAYNLNRAGFTGNMSLAAMHAALSAAGTITYLDIRLTFNSSGSAQAIVNLRSRVFGAVVDDYPAVGNVRDGIDYFNGALTGVLELPEEDEVLTGVGYGANGSEFLGTLDPATVFTLPLQVVELTREVIEL